MNNLSNETLRLQVFLSRSGFCSRRAAMDVVQAGRVTVNGERVSEPSTPVTPGKDRVVCDGKQVMLSQQAYVLLNKPAGYTTTKSDRFARHTVMELLPPELQHLNPVGRLDRETQGLLLLTNDGELANRLTHPKFDIDKTYVVTMNRALTKKIKQRLEKGVIFDGKRSAPAKVRILCDEKDSSEFEITVHEGRKRQIRRMVETVGGRVTALKRIRQGPLILGDLPPGGSRSLSKDEIKGLYRCCGLRKP